MSDFDFDKLTDRTVIGSYKWDIAPGELPMWVADMDFEVCPEIQNYIKQRLQNPTFGYNIIPDSWYQAYINWWKNRHNFLIQKEWLMFSTGVVPSISSVVRRLTNPGENVVIMTPVYNIFFNSIINNGRVALESPLKYENGEYCIDFLDLEKKLSHPQTTLLILCNPHNPVGKIWDRKTLERVGVLCYQYGVKVISDEIHCDIVRPNQSYTPFASVSQICKEISITCIAPTKAFNIAGLQTSAIVVPNQNLFNTVYRGINNDEIAEPNSFAIGACVTAFEKGEKWLYEMVNYVFDNRNIVENYIKNEISDLKVIFSDATYLVWIDCKNLCNDSVFFTDYIRKKTGLYLCDGVEYGKSGQGFVRMNVACPKPRLYDGLDRLKRAVLSYKAEFCK